MTATPLYRTASTNQLVTVVCTTPFWWLVRLTAATTKWVRPADLKRSHYVVPFNNFTGGEDGAQPRDHKAAALLRTICGAPA